MHFKGFPDAKMNFVRLPEAFFGDLLPQIDDLAELKLTLYALWRLECMGGELRYLVLEDFRQDALLLQALSAEAQVAEAALQRAIDLAVQRGSLLVARVDLGSGPQALYFFNTPRGRAAVAAIAQGAWRPTAAERAMIELLPVRPNIYQLYEEQIGPITPLLAETLQDAEDDYPADWIVDAFRIAAEKNVRNWRYVAAILRRWQEEGRDERTDRRDSEEARRRYADWED
ncbi:MAG: DnaD domain protein [Anaerolineales bacterium]|nr:DnaD domain protein [Anaerolineales bacterium]